MLPYMNPFSEQGVVTHDDPWSVPKAKAEAGDPQAVAEAYKKQGQYGRYQLVNDPFAYQQQQMDMLRNDPQYQQYANAQMGAMKNYGRDIKGIGRSNREFRRDIGSKGQWMNQADRFAQKAGQAATQNAQMDIARQGALQSRGGMTPAAIRQSMMAQGQTSAGMQAQIAAQRMQSRQEAQRSYLAARQQALQNQQQLASMRGNQFNMAAQARGQNVQEFGGAAQIGGTAHANQINTLFNMD